MESRIPLNDICEKKIDTLPSQHEGEIEYIDISSVDNVAKTIVSTQILAAKEAPSRAKQLVKCGDILVSTVRPNLNAVAVIQGEADYVLVASTGYCVLRCDAKTDNHYVFYFCQSPYFVNDMVRQATGASYPAVSNSIVKNCLIPLRSHEEQHHIAAVLDKVSNLISLRKQQLAKLDELVKARFVEMFGLPGAESHQWPMEPLGRCCILNPKKNMDFRLVPGLMVSFVPMTAVFENGDIDVSDIREYDEVKTGFTYFAENDVLFAKITPCMENGKGAIAQALQNGIGFGSTEFHVLRPISGKSNPYWLYTITSFEQFRINAETNMTGSAGQRRVPVSFLKTYQIALPPIELQERFAVFARQVSAQKSTIQQSLDKLEVLKKSLMQEYFG